MFGDSLLEASWDQRSRRGWITFTSFGLQSGVIGLLLLIPLLTTVGLPSSRILQPPASFAAPPPPARSIERQHRTTVPQSNLANSVPITPAFIPPTVAVIQEAQLPPQADYNAGLGVVGSTGNGGGGVLNGLGRANQAIPAPPPTPTIRAFRTSTILEGSLIRRVQPVYPPIARTAHVQGSVVLAALIGKEGTIENLRLISGHPMLSQAAIAAVSQWRYRPYILNGEAIEVETQITVNFILSGN
jgi:protein TonB